MCTSRRRAQEPLHEDRRLLSNGAECGGKPPFWFKREHRQQGELLTKRVRVSEFLPCRDKQGNVDRIADPFAIEFSGWSELCFVGQDASKEHECMGFKRFPKPFETGCLS